MQDPALEALKALHKFGNSDCDCPRCNALRAQVKAIVESKLPPELHVAAQFHIAASILADTIGQWPLMSRKHYRDLAIENINRVYDHSLTKQGKGN